MKAKAIFRYYFYELVISFLMTTFAFSSFFFLIDFIKSIKAQSDLTAWLDIMSIMVWRLPFNMMEHAPIWLYVSVIYINFSWKKKGYWRSFFVIGVSSTRVAFVLAFFYALLGGALILIMENGVKDWMRIYHQKKDHYKNKELAFTQNQFYINEKKAYYFMDDKKVFIADFSDSSHLVKDYKFRDNLKIAVDENEVDFSWKTLKSFGWDKFSAKQKYSLLELLPEQERLPVYNELLIGFNYAIVIMFSFLFACDVAPFSYQRRFCNKEVPFQQIMIHLIFLYMGLKCPNDMISYTGLITLMISYWFLGMIILYSTSLSDFMIALKKKNS